MDLLPTPTQSGDAFSLAGFGDTLITAGNIDGDGASGLDTLSGQSGMNVLIGFSGDDTLQGTNDNDIFLTDLGGDIGSDLFQDFDPLEDTLWFTNVSDQNGITVTDTGTDVILTIDATAGPGAGGDITIENLGGGGFSDINDLINAGVDVVIS